MPPFLHALPEGGLIVSSYPVLMDVLVKDRMNDLLREAENDRLSDQIARPSRPIRVRMADRLRAAARWIEGQPQLAGA